MSIAPYGYTLTIWTTGGVLTHAQGLPSTLDALLFMSGAVGGFALLGLAAFGDVHARVQLEPHPPALWGGLHVLSIGIAIAAATLIAHQVHNAGAWPLGGFASTLIYLAVLAAQLALST